MVCAWPAFRRGDVRIGSVAEVLTSPRVPSTRKADVEVAASDVCYGPDLYFTRMSAREPASLITIVITAGCKCPTFTMICAYIRPIPAGQGSANDSSIP